MGADADLEEGDITRRRVRRGAPTAPVPVLGRLTRPAAGALSAELAQETDGRDRSHTAAR